MRFFTFLRKVQNDKFYKGSIYIEKRRILFLFDKDSSLLFKMTSCKIAFADFFNPLSLRYLICLKFNQDISQSDKHEFQNRVQIIRDALFCALCLHCCLFEFDECCVLWQYGELRLINVLRNHVGDFVAR